MDDWIDKEKSRKAYNELMHFICTSHPGGMTNFRMERSLILKLSYSCLENSDKNFAQCQKEAWKLRKNLGCKY